MTPDWGFIGLGVLVTLNLVLGYLVWRGSRSSSLRVAKMLRRNSRRMRERIHGSSMSIAHGTNDALADVHRRLDKAVGQSRRALGLSEELNKHLMASHASREMKSLRNLNRKGAKPR